MNTLVETDDGDDGGSEPPAPATPREGSPGEPARAAVWPTKAGVPDPLDAAAPTLFEVVVSADHMTLVEVAPQSGHTLLLRPEKEFDLTSALPRPSASAAKEALARTIVATPPSGGARLMAALGLARPHRLRIWGPVLACVLSLGATAIPLWRRAPRAVVESDADAIRATTTVAAPVPLPVPPPVDDPGARVPSATDTDAGRPGPAGTAAQPAASARRRHPTVGNGGRRKARGPVMRTRNGAPVVE